MIHTSVLIPQRDAGAAIAAQMPRLRLTLDRLGRPYEIIVIDDGSAPLTRHILEDLLKQQPSVRVLHLDRPAGISAALTAGIAAARGEVLVTIEAGQRYRSEQIAELLSQLVRADLVFGRERRSGLSKVWHRLGRLPRWLLLGLEVRNPECLFWAARKESLAGLELPRGMYRYLPTLVAMRGYRVGEIPIQPLFPSRSAVEGFPNPGDLLAAWWLRRRWQNFTVNELHSCDEHKVAFTVPYEAPRESHGIDAAPQAPPYVQQRRSA
jgi:glycosyltransferase involved in cell wall biosynthesis